MVSFRPLRIGLFYDPFQMAPNSTAEINGGDPNHVSKSWDDLPTRVRHFVWVFLMVTDDSTNWKHMDGPEKHPRLLLQSSKILCSLLVVGVRYIELKYDIVHWTIPISGWDLYLPRSFRSCRHIELCQIAAFMSASPKNAVTSCCPLRQRLASKGLHLSLDCLAEDCADRAMAGDQFWLGSLIEKIAL